LRFKSVSLMINRHKHSRLWLQKYFRSLKHCFLFCARYWGFSKHTSSMLDSKWECFEQIYSFMNPDFYKLNLFTIAKSFKRSRQRTKFCISIWALFFLKNSYFWWNMSFVNYKYLSKLTDQYSPISYFTLTTRYRRFENH
jgi:hypothetical protein